VSIVIDELTILLNSGSQESNQIFANDLDRLINVIARQFSVWTTVCNQKLFQLDIKIRKTLLAMGTKIIGPTQDKEAALMLAEALLPYDPRRIKRFDPIYGGHQGQLIDLQPVTWMVQEQQQLAAQLFTRLRPFHFLVKPALGEGDVTGNLRPLSIENIDRGIWIDEPAVEEIRARLLPLTGQPLATVLAAVHERRVRFRRILAGVVATDPSGPTPPVVEPAPVEYAKLKQGRLYQEDVNDLASFRESRDRG
jgi:hypothetical protein